MTPGRRLGPMETSLMTAQPNNASFEPDDIEFEPAIRTGRDSAAKVVGIARRHKWHIIVSVLVTIGLAILFIVQSVTKYTSSASVMIDSKQVGVSANSAFEGALAFDTGAVDSQVLLLESDRIASGVIDHLDLFHNSAFLDPPMSGLGIAASFVKKEVTAAANALGADISDVPFANFPVDIQRNLLIEQLQYNLKVTRNARTYVLEIDYTDADAALSRSIAEAFAAVYLQDELESRFDVARRAGEWLQERTTEIKAKADRATAEADAYRIKHDLTQASGVLINDQALTASSTQLSIARNDLTSAQAKYTRLKQIVDTKDYAGSSLDALSDPIISGLQSKYLDAYKMNADISSRISPKHEAAVKARKDMDQYSQLIFEELQRLLDSYASEVKIDSERVANLESSIQKGRGVNNVDFEATSKLNELQLEATTYSNLYNVYIQKGQDLLQQNAIPISDARIISDAELPILPSSPKKLLILLGSVVFGIAVGAGIASLREYRERGFRTSSQIRDELGFEFVSYLPKLPKSAFEARGNGPGVNSSPPGAPNTFRSNGKAFDVVLDEPMSSFSESLRSVKLAVDYRFGAKRPLAIGFISAYPNEGKSTAAKNFASLLARQNENVLLMDCDLRNPHLTRNLTPQARHGLLDLLVSGEVSVEDALYREQGSNLAFLPASARGRVPATGDVLASSEMASLMEQLRANFSIIIVDFAPIGALTDASAAAGFIDGYQLVVEWGHTPRTAVVAALATNPLIAGRTVGVSLSKVALEKLELFEGGDGYGYGSGKAYMTRYYLPHTEPRPAIGE